MSVYGLLTLILKKRYIGDVNVQPGGVLVFVSS